MAVIRDYKKKNWNWFKELNLKEHTLYKVRVKVVSNNPVHISYLYSGFSSGNYLELYTNNYECPIELGPGNIYSIHIIEELSPIKDLDRYWEYDSFKFRKYYLEEFNNDYEKCMEYIKLEYAGLGYEVLYDENDASITVNTMN